MIPSPDLKPLVPQTHQLPNGRPLYCFQNNALELTKLDLTFEAGSCLQSHKSQAHGANQLLAEVTKCHNPQQVAELLDFRGIVVEKMTDVCVGNVSFYFLRRYAEELFPLIREMFDAPLVTQPLFDAYRAKRRQQLLLGMQKTAYVARNKFYEALYGFNHPLGTYAQPTDLDLLTADRLSGFMCRHYHLDSAHMVLSGYVDDALLALADQHLSPTLVEQVHATVLPRPMPSHQGSATIGCPMDNAVQSTLRIGRILPLEWHQEEYARFMVLNTVLGGYFGSRLMSNIREDKGYTYGIYSTTQVYRGSIVFYITADVAAEATQAAVAEVYKEIDRLKQEPVPDEELERVRNYMMGDFIRSIDGAFEISERYRQMAATAVDDRLTTLLLDAVATVTPAQLQELAQTYLADLVTVVAGPQEALLK